MKVIEVQFDGHVRMPGTPRMTNVMKTSEEHSVGNPVKVDSLEETTNGIIATKRTETDGKLVTHRKLFSWASVLEVMYEPTVQPLPAEDKKK